MGYITNFIVYTLAMVGVMVVALLVFKNTTAIGNCKSSKYLKIIDSISLGQRKNLYIVSTGNEQFLIAGDVNNTSLISKLNLSNSNTLSTNNLLQDNLQAQNYMINMSKNVQNASESFQDACSGLNNKTYTDKPSIYMQNNLSNKKSDTSASVIQNIAQILKK